MKEVNKNRDQDPDQNENLDQVIIINWWIEEGEREEQVN